MSNPVDFSLECTEKQSVRLVRALENYRVQEHRWEHGEFTMLAHPGCDEVIERTLQGKPYTTIHSGAARDLIVETYFFPDKTFSHQTLDVHEHWDGSGYRSEPIDKFDELYESMNDEEG